MKFLQNDNLAFLCENIVFMSNLQPGLSGNPFYATKWSEKIGSGRRIKLPKSFYLSN